MNVIVIKILLCHFLSSTSYYKWSFYKNNHKVNLLSFLLHFLDVVYSTDFLCKTKQQKYNSYKKTQGVPHGLGFIIAQKNQLIFLNMQSYNQYTKCKIFKKNYLQFSFFHIKMKSISIIFSHYIWQSQKYALIKHH